MQPESFRPLPYVVLLRSPGRWTAIHERRLRELLGYEDGENQIYLKDLKETD
jgi:hypothetical protein